jgi:hypothetical protein
LHFEHSDLPIIGSLVGVTFDSLVARIVESAAERIPPSPANRPEHAHHHSPQ